MTAFGILLVVVGIVLMVVGDKTTPSYPPWTVLRHGDTWAFVNDYGQVNDVRYASRARAENAMRWHQDFMEKWKSGGWQKREEQKKLESAPGYWEKEK